MWFASAMAINGRRPIHSWYVSPNFKCHSNKSLKKSGKMKSINDYDLQNLIYMKMQLSNYWIFKISQ